MTIRTGLCSVTFRQLTPEQIVPLVADAGLEVIEWGADVHVLPGDPERAAQVAALTTDAGITVCSYGSYFRAGGEEELTPHLDSAQALGADRVRVWAGKVGSDAASPAEYAEVVGRLRDAVAEASARGIELALEYHRGTLADAPESVLRLLADVNAARAAARPLSTYWQPRVGAADAAALDESIAVAAHTSAVHVFSWWPETERLALSARGELWQRVFENARAGMSPPRDALLEFILGDDPALLASEAATLRTLVAGR